MLSANRLMAVGLAIATTVAGVPTPIFAEGEEITAVTGTSSDPMAGEPWVRMDEVVAGDDSVKAEVAALAAIGTTAQALLDGNAGGEEQEQPQQQPRNWRGALYDWIIEQLGDDYAVEVRIFMALNRVAVILGRALDHMESSIEQIQRGGEVDPITEQFIVAMREEIQRERDEAVLALGAFDREWRPLIQNIQGQLATAPSPEATQAREGELAVALRRAFFGNVLPSESGFRERIDAEAQRPDLSAEVRGWIQEWRGIQLQKEMREALRILEGRRLDLVQAVTDLTSADPRGWAERTMRLGIIWIHYLSNAQFQAALDQYRTVVQRPAIERWIRLQREYDALLKRVSDALAGSSTAP